MLACSDVTEQWGSNKRLLSQRRSWPNVTPTKYTTGCFSGLTSTKQSIIHIRKLTKAEFLFSSPLDKISESAVSMSTLSEWTFTPESTGNENNTLYTEHTKLCKLHVSNHHLCLLENGTCISSTYFRTEDLLMK